MHQVGALVGRAHRARAVRGRLGDRFVAREAGPHRKAFPPIADELLGQRPFVQSTAGGPARGRRDPSRGSNRSMLVIRHHCEKAAVADEPRTFEHGFDVARKRRERAVVVWRTHDPGVHQLRRPEVVHESKRAGHDLAQAKRLDAPSSWCSLDLRSQRCPRVDRKREGPVFDELPEMQRPVRLVRAHQPVDHHRGDRGARLRTARSTLGCAPHRHRCGSRAARIAPSSGHGFLRRRAVIATTSPGVQ